MGRWQRHANTSLAHRRTRQLGLCIGRRSSCRATGCRTCLLSSQKQLHLARVEWTPVSQVW